MHNANSNFELTCLSPTGILTEHGSEKHSGLSLGTDSEAWVSAKALIPREPLLCFLGEIRDKEWDLDFFRK
jgi:hypothetical protein